VEALLVVAHELGLGDLQGRGGDAGRLARGGLGWRQRRCSDGGGLSLGEAAGSVAWGWSTHAGRDGWGRWNPPTV